MSEPQSIKSVEDRKDEELVHDLFKVFPRVFSKKEPRDEYFINLVSKGDITVNDIAQAPVVQAVTTNPDIIKRAILRFRGFTVADDIVKQCTYPRTDAQNTLVIKELPLGLQQEQVIALFHNETTAGPRAVSARPDQHNTWYVNFASEEDCRTAYGLGKNLAYEGKLLRVSVKRDHFLRHGYDPRGAMGRPDYAGGVDMMQMGPGGGMAPMMNPFQMYYPPAAVMAANRAYYYPPPPAMPYAPMGVGAPPMMYPMDMSMGYQYYMPPQTYYAPNAQQQQQAPQQGGSQQQQQPMSPQSAPYQGRRPGRGGGAYSNQGAPYQGGRGYNGPRRDRSPRTAEQQSAVEQPQYDAQAANAEQVGEEKPLAVAGAVAPVAEESAAVTVEETTLPVALETLDVSEGKKEGAEKKAPRQQQQRSEGERPANKNFAGERERRTSDRSKFATGVAPRNNGGKPRDRSQPSSGGRTDNSEAKKDKPKAAPIKFTMDADFPILVDQKQGVGAPQNGGFDYANAVKKAPVLAAPVSPVEQPAAPLKPVVEAPAPAPTPVAVEKPQPVHVEVAKVAAAVEAAVSAAPVAVETESKLAAPTGTTKKSFLDALKANQ